MSGWPLERRRATVRSNRPLLGVDRAIRLGKSEDMKAYVVVTVEAGKAREVARQVASLAGVKMADACWGSRDIFVVIEARDSQELNKLVMNKIQKLEGVRDTSTHVAIDE